jgi:hypothetical protein
VPAGPQDRKASPGPQAPQPHSETSKCHEKRKVTTCVTTLHYSAGTKRQRVLRETQTCTSRGGVTNCTTTYGYSAQASARVERVIGIAMVHGHVAQIAEGRIEHRRLKLSLHRLARGRYHVSILVSRKRRVFVQIGRIWIRVP